MATMAMMQVIDMMRRRVVEDSVGCSESGTKGSRWRVFQLRLTTRAQAGLGQDWDRTWRDGSRLHGRLESAGQGRARPKDVQQQDEEAAAEQHNDDGDTGGGSRMEPH
jgi:hypothetical protein